jgi:hypothetical protein
MTDVMPIVSLMLLAAVSAGAADGSLTDGGDGTLKDSGTGLVWTRQDNGADIDWNAAKKYCEELALAGSSDWRLPTIEELELLYQPDTKSGPTYRYRDQDYPLKMDPLFQLTAPGLWSGTERYTGMGVAWTFFFSSGRKLASRGNFSNYQRALCVQGAASQ